MKETKKLQDWVFRQVHTKNLVYNTCWEDPRCDREMMDLQDDSEIVMITSAGCNALDYLIDQPRRIHCVDMNPRQNALLELKLAAFQRGDYNNLFELFGQGKHQDSEAVYREELRELLPEFAQDYWDKNHRYFNGKGLRKTFYHYSTSGTVAWLAGQYLKSRKKLYKTIRQLFDAESLEKQANLYYQIEQKLLNGMVEWVFNRHFTMCLVGVPRSQQELFATKYRRGAMGFLQECLRKVFAEQPIQDNYFWRLYFEGSYRKDCCPSYLQKEHFSTIQQQTEKVDTHTTTISQFLKDNPGTYSHFVLLDHQDWLAANDRPALEEEWDLIMQNSRPGTKILLRSAAHEIDFFPNFIQERIHFEQEKTAETHRKDRVGTYASVYLGIVQ